MKYLLPENDGFWGQRTVGQRIFIVAALAVKLLLLFLIFG